MSKKLNNKNIRRYILIFYNTIIILGLVIRILKTRKRIYTLAIFSLITKDDRAKK
jgi:hypothetical protein